MTTTKLWQKEETKSPKWLEDFTAGKDQALDIELAEFDVIGSLAHVSMLAKVGLINRYEFVLLQKELNRILKTIRSGKFGIENGVEDIHSQIEMLLTEKLGETGKKIHTARSRNDQVLVDIKLYCKNKIKETVLETQKLFEILIQLSDKYKDTLVPGYTHFQAAMPSSFGLWFGSYAESLCDDLEMVKGAFAIVNRNPLGSGAGYGSSLPINRAFTTEVLNFESMNYNVVYAQMTRGKTEKVVCMALANIASTLSKMSMDICLYNSQNFGFVKFPDHLTTGSSIMPHKKNPDVFELIRAKCNRIQALPNELTLLCNNLPSGYHRDLQLTKEILFPAFKEMNDCLKAAVFMLEEIQLNKNILNDKKYELIFSVEAVNELVKSGLPFREAYQLIGKKIENGEFTFDSELDHTHEGSIGNLMDEEIKQRFEKLVEGFLTEAR
jgi:argininosuccinate lyase